MSGKNCLVECGPPQDRQEGENSKRLSKVVRKRGYSRWSPVSRAICQTFFRSDWLQLK